MEADDTEMPSPQYWKHADSGAGFNMI